MIMNPVHFSTLKKMALSPLHYRYACDHAIEETRAMRVGSVVHALVLGGSFHLYEGERRGKAWIEFREAHVDGATIVTSSEHEDALAIAESVLANPVAWEVLSVPHQCELSLEWEWLGRSCAGRLDMVAPDYLAELKVSASTEPDRFCAQANRMHYPAQLAWYLRALGRPLTSRAVIIAVEDKPPYPVTVREVTQRALENGEKQCRLWMERLLVCEAANQWPGYAQTASPLDVPDWAENQNLIIDGEEIAL
jgi:hypothetical protein